MLDLNRLEELEKKATPGEWSAICIEYVVKDGKKTLGWDDNNFILALRNAFPSLAKELFALRALKDEVDGMDIEPNLVETVKE